MGAWHIACPHGSGSTHPDPRSGRSPRVGRPTPRAPNGLDPLNLPCHLLSEHGQGYCLAFDAKDARRRLSEPSARSVT
jgi:hypothetical protein